MMLAFVTSLLSCYQAQAFQPVVQPASRRRSAVVVVANALSPRQLQFWEDVDDGLVDIEKFYEAKGESMERIRTFCKRWGAYICVSWVICKNYLYQQNLSDIKFCGQSMAILLGHAEICLSPSPHYRAINLQKNISMDSRQSLFGTHLRTQINFRGPHNLRRMQI